MSAPDLTAALERIPGWFWPTDQRLFEWFLSNEDVSGDVLEMGTYLGKSAVLIGGHVRRGETFTVCDLFESDAPDADNDAETTRSYSSLTRDRFERNYLSVHDALPEIVHGPTSVILDHVKADTCRFVHVDASHLYTHVKGDVLAARTVLREGGIVAFDDYRSEHTPGVALAVWEAVAGLGLAPVCVSTQKLYGTWGDPAPVRERLLAWLATRPDLWHTTDVLGEHHLVRVNQRKKPKPAQPQSDLDRLATELRHTTAELKKVTAESQNAVQALKKATKEVSVLGPVAHRAAGWLRRRGTPAK
ncbi:class I SAM-dependent methyltransferase [Nonomuraea rubra]|uniref:Putative O-methyltransferase YrrM n=1 Tax=Nonomuraea rubra TaxID=46180 RepID=A0A7X0TW21_9ACTN|nr:class I SAM-dependent methyltransferase [Nonomuraea rubra]MBB6545729.1 putative O-methyltransferase YrrM [Nonomuraea rubra]